MSDSDIDREAMELWLERSSRRLHSSQFPFPSDGESGAGRAGRAGMLTCWEARLLQVLETALFLLVVPPVKIAHPHFVLATWFIDRPSSCMASQVASERAMDLDWSCYPRFKFHHRSYSTTNTHDQQCD